MKAKLNLIGLLILTLVMTGCNQTGKLKNFDYGHTEKNKYYNSFFGLDLTLPDNWIVQTKEQTENLTKMGKDLVAGDDKNFKALINASEVNSANLLALFQYEVGAAVEYNPSFMLVAENLKSAPGIKTGSDYLFQSRKLLKQSQIQYSYIDDEFTKEVINNQEFYVMNCSIDYMGYKINQVYYSTLKDGFCLSAIISFINDEQKNNLEKILNSMNFEK
jgi:hypothetical protein